MRRGAKEIAAGLVLALLAAGLVWLALSGNKKPAESAPVEEAAPVEETMIEESAPAMEEVEVADEAPLDVPDIAEALPAPGEMSPALIPVSPKPELDPEVQAILDGMKAHLGWDRIKTLKGKLRMNIDGTATMTGEMIVEDPNKVNVVFEIKSGEQTVIKMYQLSDGVFMEMGTISPEGKRIPMKMDRDQGTTGASPFTGQFFDPSVFNYEEVSTVPVDASDPLFQNEDGSPMAMTEVKRLRASKEGNAMDFYIDPASMQWVGMRVYEGEEVFMECGQMKYEDIGEGIIYPTSYSFRVNPSLVNPAAPKETLLKFELSDLEVNPELPADTFNFTMNLEPGNAQPASPTPPVVEQ